MPMGLYPKKIVVGKPKLPSAKTFQEAAARKVFSRKEASAYRNAARISQAQKLGITLGKKYEKYR